MKKRNSFKNRFFVCLSLIVSLISLTPSNCYSANIIFDLGGVLLGVSKKNSLKHIGLYSLFAYTLKLNNPFALKSRLFDTLSSISAISQNQYGAEDGNGQPLPNIMCDWLSGLKTCQEIRNLITTFIEEYPEAFKNNSELSMIKQMSDCMFTAQHFANSTYLLKEGVRFLNNCKEQGHKLFVLSNWDPESFPYVYQKHQEIFDLFDDIIISGEIGTIKPDPIIYEYLLIKNNLNRNECIFFDDQLVNVEAAQNSFHAIHCKKPSYHEMKKGLKLFLQEQENNQTESRNHISG